LAQASLFFVLVSFSSGFFAAIQLALLPNRVTFSIPPLPCHNTTDWLKRIKERNSTNTLLPRYTSRLKCIPGDHVMKLVERMASVQSFELFIVLMSSLLF
jgi:hypothetical protein